MLYTYLYIILYYVMFSNISSLLSKNHENSKLEKKSKMMPS
jgi:hypothetical protein